MIVVDTSAIVAILLHEPQRQMLLQRLLREPQKGMAMTALLEATIVLSRAFADPVAPIRALLDRTTISLTQIDEAHAAVAQQAFLAYGKGRHPARLNFGDCFSYAAARLADAPLLYVGSDFAATDIRSAL